mgnify:CR=1 FL=1
MIYRTEIHEYLKMCFQTTYGKSDDVLIHSKIDKLVEFINDGKAYVFGAFVEDVMIGFLWGYPVKGPFETVFHIAYIAVAEQGREKGTGSKLVSVAEKHARTHGIHHVELIVGVDNHNALEFYTVMGYGQDRCIMRKRIK